jgi:hypothetical protein
LSRHLADDVSLVSVQFFSLSVLPDPVIADTHVLLDARPDSWITDQFTGQGDIDLARFNSDLT